jgi:hypothetical protein
VASAHCPANWLKSGALGLPITFPYAAFSSKITTTCAYVAGALTPVKAHGSVSTPPAGTTSTAVPTASIATKLAASCADRPPTPIERS